MESGKNIWQNAAEAAMKDVLQNFWYQDAESGHLIKTDHGLPMADERQQGMMWEHATMVFVLETYADMTGSEEAKKRLAAQWQYTLSEFNEEKRTGLFGREPNIAADDAGWGAMAFMTFYRATGDIQALKSAGELVNGAYDHWAVNGDIAQLCRRMGERSADTGRQCMDESNPIDGNPHCAGTDHDDSQHGAFYCSGRFGRTKKLF